VKLKEFGDNIMWLIAEFIIALIICWSGYFIFYPNHNILMVLSITGSFLLLDKLKAYLKKDCVLKKNMRLTSFCLLGATISILLFVPNLFQNQFLLVLGSPIGLVGSLPVLWGVVKKAKNSEFYLRAWTIDWPSIQIIILGTLFSILTIISAILMIITIEMRIDYLIKIIVVVLAGTNVFFVSNYIVIRIAECLYRGKFYMLGTEGNTEPE
jgi:hypothetical protein